VTDTAADAERRLGAVDAGLYALFSRHADRARHDRHRHVFRAAALGSSFDVFLSRAYGLSWLAFVGVSVVGALTVLVLPGTAIDATLRVADGVLPLSGYVSAPALPRPFLALPVGVGVGLLAKRLTVRASIAYLGWVADARRSDIETTLPSAVRYLRVLAAGTSDRRELLRRVARQEAYGETAVAFRRALTTANLTGSLDRGLTQVARDTPSRDLLSPFLLKFREHAAQGGDALEGYLQMEGRLLSNRQQRAHERASGFLELLAELFVVLLVFPALLVLILTVASVLTPALRAPVWTPLGPMPLRSVLVMASAGFVLVVGAVTALLVESLRPATTGGRTRGRPADPLAVVATAGHTPASTLVVATPVGVALALALAVLGVSPLNTVLLGYVAVGLPVGLVAMRRARIDDAKDREIRDFIHAVAGHVSLGRPFPDAVDRVAREVDLGALQADVDWLAYTLSLTTAKDESADVRAAALDGFVDRVGTPLAAQSIGLVVGALETGSDTEAVFETLQTEIGRLYHERKELRSKLMVYVAVGWTTALLVVGIVVAVNTQVLDGFAQLSTVAGGGAGVSFEPTAIDPGRARQQFYLVTQATMLACGWFAGASSRGRYEALFHSAALVGITYVVFAGAGMI
jgi:archaellum biogenesis protein FlaJ (TadC family)